jgi:hypothetical protein
MILRIDSLITRLLLIYFTFVLCGCAGASFTQTGERYPTYDKPVKIYFEVPDVEYERIGIVSAQGGAFQQRADILKDMQEEAAEYGANAIIIISEETRESLVVSSTDLGTYGGTTTKRSASAVAVRMTTNDQYNNKKDNLQYKNTKSKSKIGISINFIPVLIGGFGGRAWGGKESLRIVGEFYSLNIPSSFWPKEWLNPRIEEAYRLTGNYYPYGDVEGVYFSSGLEYTTTSVGYQGTNNRTRYGSFYTELGIGYTYYPNDIMYFDSSFSLNIRWGNSQEICVTGGGCTQPAAVTPIGFFGVGVNF